jgi:aerobic carbon-monoxide dehydrogenase medium subunit
MIQLARAELNPKVLVHIENLTEHKYIRAGKRLEIGALTSQRVLAEHETIVEDYGALRLAASLCGGWQTQSVGTIGGNVCNASPAADLIPPLMVHGARLTLQSRSRGQRSVEIDAFIVGRRKIAREPDEMLTSFSLDPVEKRTADCFVKVGRRNAMEISIANIAIRLKLGEDETVNAIRIAVGAVGPVAFRACEAEELLRGQRVTQELVDAAGRSIVRQATPITDVRGSREYRLAVLPRILRSVLKQCVARAQRQSPAPRQLAESCL